MHRSTMKPYIDVWRTVLELKRAVRDAPLETLENEVTDSVLDKVYRLARVLREQSSDPDHAGFQPFPRIRTLRDDFLKFADDIEEPASPGSPPSRRKQLRQQLRDLLARFEEVFESEVERRPVFIAQENNELLKYLSLDTWLRDQGDREVFGYLPRVAQSNLESGGQCLAYGLHYASLGLALQAVEATLRYFYHRHILIRREQEQDRPPEWRYMVNALGDNLPAPSADSRKLLDDLRLQHRNLIMHGRAYHEAGRNDDPEEVFRNCWRAARLLMYETPHRPQLRIKVRICPSFDFDTVLAVYLFYWNPELPPFGPNAVEFDASMTSGTLRDLTLTPNGELIEPRSNNDSLTYSVLKYLQVQSSYKSAIEPLVDFVRLRRAGIGPGFDPAKPNTLDLADLFQGIRLRFDDPQVALNEAWSMLDKFLKRPWLAPRNDDGRLIADLEQQAAYDALCRYHRQ